MPDACPDSRLRQAALLSKAWPFEEARRLKPHMERMERVSPSENAAILFQTGYGPSGLPHLGTFAEVLRTSMVRHAFSLLHPHIPTRLLCFSDDMDALRSIPDNIPNPQMLRPHLGKPLSQVPDPFATHDSFAAHNNARLRDFLDRFGFDYEFVSASEQYRAGRLDAMMLRVLHNYDAIMEVMLPSLREERRKSYAPFLPLCPHSGKILMVAIVERDAQRGIIRYRHPEDGSITETPVTGGCCKLQWKVDWAARWAALGINYEMSGKDLIESVRLSARICRILGGTPPAGFSYELFLDANGEKISKSRGNGMTMDEWLRYAVPESLALFLYREPRRAKRLHFPIIPQCVDEYLGCLDAYPRQSAGERLGNPVWHIHNGTPPAADSEHAIGFQLLLNLVNASNATTADTLWSFLQSYAPHIAPDSHPQLHRLVQYALTYYHDRIAPTRHRRPPTPAEARGLENLASRLGALPADADAKSIQNEVYAAGKEAGFAELRAWFQSLYEVLLGQKQGPRFGSFIRFYGMDNSIALIRSALPANDTPSASVN